MKKLMTKILALAMTATLLTGCGTGTPAADSGSSESSLGIERSDLYSDKEITLNVYSQLANYSGEMQGWFAKILKEKWNVKINIIMEGDGVYETRMESGNLGDIVVWGSDGKQYQQAVENGMLYDWEEDDLLADYGPYIKEHMSKALEKNRLVSAPKDEDGNPIEEKATTIYGFGNNVASSAENHETFFYTWDIRWDLYQQLGHPEVKNLNDMISLFEKMKEICPIDDSGNPTYAMSLWPDWDGSMVMYVKAMATAYYGYDEADLGLYDPETGEYYYCLDDGPYLEMLKFFFDLKQKGLLDPDSMTQTYDKMSEKVQNGGVFFSIFNYAGNASYNTDEHIAANKIMRSLVPTEASPLAYGMSVYGSNRIWSIGAKTQYPEICMEIINWLCTPEGRTTLDYGPKGLTWDYDENNKCYFTELGLKAITDRSTMMPEEWGGATFNDGSFQINNITWSPTDINPVSGEKYDKEFWSSTQSPEGKNAADQDWRDFTGCLSVEEYMEKTNYKVAIATTFSASKLSDELESVKEQIQTCVKDYSWKAIYAADEEEFNKIVNDMKNRARSYDPTQKVKAWAKSECDRKYALQLEVTK